MLADTIRAGCGGMMDRLTGGSVTARAHAIQRAGRFLAPGVVVRCLRGQANPRPAGRHAPARLRRRSLRTRQRRRAPPVHGSLR
jgi:hypothetical protein